MKRPSVILVVMLAIVLVCLAIGGLFVYKNFFVSETEKASVIEEKVEEKKEIPKEPIVFPKEEEMIPEKEIAKKEEIATTVEEPAEPVKETPIISVPKKEKEIAKKAEEETPKAVEIAKTERRDVEKEEITATKPVAETKTAEDARDIKEITGLITEETMTNAGYKFYENFCLFWKAPEQGIQVYSISIHEKANPSWGSWIQVSVNARMSPTIVWSNVVRPGPEEVVEAAKKAVEATEKYLSNYEEYQKQLKGVDMSGDGIY